MTCARWALLLAASLVWHCAGTPQTEPPNLEPGRIEVQPVTRGTKSTSTLLVGGPGSAAPAGATIHIVNLDSQDAEVLATIDANGSFQAEIGAFTGQMLRLQIVDGSRRFKPVDLIVDGTTVSAYVPTLPCLTTEPQAEAVFGDATSASVQIRNQCEQSVLLSAVRLRFGSAAFSLGVVPASVDSGATATVIVTYTSSGGPDEDILILETSSPKEDRRAVTLFGK